jgi:[citrate (pro-3S)-lyase] ligase
MLHISKRFVGSESFDNITGQYIETLAAILPKHGIDLEVIHRYETNGKIVSASLVRKLLESRDFEGIAEIVPKSTYDYLCEMYREK